MRGKLVRNRNRARGEYQRQMERLWRRSTVTAGIAINPEKTRQADTGIWFIKNDVHGLITGCFKFFVHDEKDERENGGIDLEVNAPPCSGAL